MFRSTKWSWPFDKVFKVKLLYLLISSTKQSIEHVCRIVDANRSIELLERYRSGFARDPSVNILQHRTSLWLVNDHYWMWKSEKSGGMTMLSTFVSGEKSIRSLPLDKVASLVKFLQHICSSCFMSSTSRTRERDILIRTIDALSDIFAFSFCPKYYEH